MKTIDTDKFTFDKYIKLGIWKQNGPVQFYKATVGTVDGLARTKNKKFIKVKFNIDGWFTNTTAYSNCLNN